MQIRQFLYFSLASYNHTETDLNELLEGSRDRNKFHHVTGLLIYVGNYFIQHIEGPPATIEQLVKNISSDDRIRDFTPLIDETKAERIFPNWLMGFRSRSTENLTTESGFINVSHSSDLDFLDPNREAALRIMKKFYEVNQGVPTF